MLLFEVGFVEIQGMATVIIFAFLFYLMTELRMIRRDMAQLQPAARTANSGLPLQAYERLTLLADRLSLKNLVTRLHSTEFSVAQLQMLLLENIRTEFEHNTTQQVYVNPEVWKAVNNMKEQNIYIINQLAAGLPPNAPAVELSKLILEYSSRENAELSNIVLDAIQYEVKKLV
ncbi:MAG: hypothetical protein Q7T76_11050 [Ferruginibacter sp.]|nr:hypothetical protein [Ferruginibacter sp.]